MPSRGDAEFLANIKEAIHRVKTHITGMSYEAFSEDIKTQDVVVRNLEIIGEAAKNISEKLKQNYPHIPWKGLAGIRDKLIHHYFGVKLDIVWNIIAAELPERNQIKFSIPSTRGR